jgi:hypothetical protein
MGQEMKGVFIADIKQFFKFWSVRIDMIALAFSGWFLAFPDSALTVWNMFPQDLKTAIPDGWVRVISVGLLVLSLIARSIRQNKLKGGANESAS